MLPQAVKGDRVRVHYTGRLKDGTVFDSSRPNGPDEEESTASRISEPLEFVVNAGQVISGFDRAVLGMRVGESKTVEIPPDEAYGEYIEELVKVVPKSYLKLDAEPQEGMLLDLRDNTDRMIQIIITEVTATTITLDANHPLAGQTLIFDIELVGIS